MNSPSGRDRRQIAGDGQQTSKASLVRILVCVAVVVLAGAILANSMTKELSRDEQMYCTAGVLLSQGLSIYEDFSYPSQLPYHPLLLAAFYKGLGTTHYLLVGRLVSAVSDTLVVILILLIYRSVFRVRRTQGLLLGLAAAVLYVFNPFVDYAAGHAWNHDVVILCVVGALWLLLTTNFQRRSRYWRAGTIGLLLTVATFMRVTTSLVELTFFVATLWMAGGPVQNRLRTALPFLAGSFIAAVWPAWVILRSPEAFRLNLVRIPTLYGDWLHEIGMTFDKAALTINAVLTPAYLALLILAGGLAWAPLRHRSNLNPEERRKMIAAALLPPVFLLIAYIPPTIWLQYMAAPVPFIAIALAYPLLALDRRTEKRRNESKSARSPVRIGPLAAFAAAGISILAYPSVLSRAVFLLVPEKWEPVRVHRISRELTQDVREPKRVLTLGPLYALEGGGDIYPELSAGDIVYRIADRMTPEERTITRTVGPATLAEMTADRPFDAVVTGIEPKEFTFLEEPLRRLVPSDWRRKSIDRLLVHSRP